MDTKTDRQLTRLETAVALVSAIYEADSISDVASVLVAHLRSERASTSRGAEYLASVHDRLAKALSEVSRVKQTESALDTALSGAESALRVLLEMIATELEKTDESASAGGVLRAASETIIRACRAIKSRQGYKAMLDCARKLEEFGAAPAALYNDFHELVWVNTALRYLLERRSIDAEKTIQRMTSLVSAQAMRTSDAGHRDHLLGLHFSFKEALAHDANNLLMVEVSEAKRATALTAREIEVARNIAKLGKYKDVAAATSMSLNSVRTHVRRIYRKFGINNQTELKARLIREGLISK
ncbi:MAG: helix-turn-helix transcriptional regulator [Planctomycetota bacterium]|jgi:DNA-binding CsgD family transcriptional regulator